MSSLDSSLVPVRGFIRPLSGHQVGETVHRFWFTGLSSFVKPPLCLAGIAAFQAVGQMHHGPLYRRSQRPVPGRRDDPDHAARDRKPLNPPAFDTHITKVPWLEGISLTLPFSMMATAPTTVTAEARSAPQWLQLTVPSPREFERKGNHVLGRLQQNRGALAPGGVAEGPVQRALDRTGRHAEGSGVRPAFTRARLSFCRGTTVTCRSAIAMSSCRSPRASRFTLEAVQSLDHAPAHPA
ncbi:hypothetical protein ACGFZQ_35970 [Streptomyces sp. NPDC048254]|uniref:hypothetical protein n=1 Tax=Streptomyces sp. NPDC048254 TaxID=3365525 RepID=UPI003720C786